MPAGADRVAVGGGGEPRAQAGHERHDGGDADHPDRSGQRHPQPHQHQRHGVGDQVTEAGMEEGRGGDAQQPLGVAGLDAVVVQGVPGQGVHHLGHPHDSDDGQQHLGALGEGRGACRAGARGRWPCAQGWLIGGGSARGAGRP